MKLPFDVPDKIILTRAIARELTLTTPALIGGADQNEPECRVPSLLGALRTWWRATAEGDAAQLRHDELALFGGPASSGLQVGAGLFTINLSALPITDDTPNSSKSTPSRLDDQFFRAYPNFRQLLGDAVDNRTAASRRRMAALPAGSRFRVSMAFRNGVAEEHKRAIEQAFSILAMFGGLGYLARRGMGSVSDLRPAQIGWDCEYYTDIVERTFKWLQGRVRHRTGGTSLNTPTFTGRSKVFIWTAPSETDPMAALEAFADGARTAPGTVGQLADFFSPQHPVSARLQLRTRNEGALARLPSPLHLHVERLSDGCLVIGLLLPVNFRAVGLARDYEDELAACHSQRLTDIEDVCARICVCGEVPYVPS